MKILMISNLYPPHWLGGYELLCAMVAEELVDRGHHVSVLTSSYELTALPAVETVSPQPQASRGEKRGATPRVHRLLELTWAFHRPRPPFSRARAVGVARRNFGVTARFIARNRPDVIFVWSLLRLTPAPGRAAAASGVPTCHSLNDEHLAGYLPSPLTWNPMSLVRHISDRTWLRTQTLFGLDLRHVTCISRRVRRNLSASGVPVEGARVIHQGVRMERFPFRGGAGAPERGARVLYVGQLQPYKGVHTVVEAVHRLAATDPARFGLTIVGDGFGPYQATLARLIRSGPASIHLAGRISQDEIAACYHAHDVFVFPSVWEEPFGLTPLEAMACGTPVISTSNGGQGEFLRDGENALVFEPQDSAGLAARIQRLACDPALRKRLARAGRATVERDYTFDRYVRQLEEFLADTVGAAPDLPTPLEVSA